jgi:hypothetical protein
MLVGIIWAIRRCNFEALSDRCIMDVGSARAPANPGWEERMISSKNYVEEDAQGALRVGSR